MTAELPRGWHTATADELASATPHALAIGPFGSSLLVADYQTSGVPLVFVRDIRRESFGDSATKFISAAKAVELAAHRVSSGDLLMTKMGDPPGDTTVYPAGCPAAIITSDCIKLTPDLRVTTAEFLNYLFRDPGVRDLVLDETKGVAQQKLSLTRFRSIPLPLAPMPEQRRIVAKLDALTTRSRRAKEALDAIPPLLERFRQSVLASAFRGDLTAAWRAKNPDVEPAEKLLARIRIERRRRWEEAELARMAAKSKLPGDDTWKQKYEEPEPANTEGLPVLPEGWAWVALAALGEIITGFTPSTGDEDNFGGAVPFFKPTDLDASYEVTRARQYLTERGAASGRVLPPKSILVTCIGTIGKTGLSRVRCATNQQINAIVTHGDFVSPEWLFWTICGPHAQDLIRMNASATTLPIINKSRFGGLLVPCPPLDEQREIVRLVEIRFRALEGVVPKVNDGMERLTMLDRAILAKAFRGDLVPQDPSDEPASVLLERIRAERASASSGKDKKKPTKRT